MKKKKRKFLINKHLPSLEWTDRNICRSTIWIIYKKILIERASMWIENPRNERDYRGRGVVGEPDGGEVTPAELSLSDVATSVELISHSDGVVASFPVRVDLLLLFLRRRRRRARHLRSDPIRSRQSNQSISQVVFKIRNRTTIIQITLFSSSSELVWEFRCPSLKNDLYIYMAMNLLNQI